MADEDSGGTISPAEQAITEGREPEQPQEQAAPEAEAPEAEAPEGAERAPAFVPMGELQKERNRRKAEAQRAAKAEQDLQRLAGRLDVLQQTYGRQQPQAEPEQPKALPSVMEAPLDHIEQQRRELDEIRQWRQQQEQQGQITQAKQQFLGHVQARENEYRASTPDYDAAINHLRADRAAELAEAGYAPEQCNQIIDGEAMAIADWSLRQGRNPAEVWYKMAARRGYKAGAQEQASVEKLQTIERGQQAGRSLSQAGGATAGGKVSLERLLAMDDRDFAKIATNPDEFRRVMGG